MAAVILSAFAMLTWALWRAPEEAEKREARQVLEEINKYGERDMTTENRVQRYVDYLTGEGYRPTVDKEGDIIVRAEGRTLIILIDDNDEDYFAMVAPNIWDIESAEEHARAQAVANDMTRRFKVAKITTSDTTVHVSVEMIAPAFVGPERYVSRSIRILLNAMSEYQHQMASKAEAA